MSDVVDRRFERFDDRPGRLEADVEEIKAGIKELDRRLGGEAKGFEQRFGRRAGGIEQRLARLEGMVSNPPSTSVVIAAAAAAASQATLLGFTFLPLPHAPK